MTPCSDYLLTTGRPRVFRTGHAAALSTDSEYKIKYSSPQGGTKVAQDLPGPPTRAVLRTLGRLSPGSWANENHEPASAGGTGSMTTARVVTPLFGPSPG